MRTDELTFEARERLRMFIGSWALSVLDDGCEVARVEVRDGSIEVRACCFPPAASKPQYAAFAQPLKAFADFGFDWRELGKIKGQHMAELCRSVAP